MNSNTTVFPRAPHARLSRVQQAAEQLDFSPDLRARIIIYLISWRSRVPGWRVEAMGRLTTSELEGILLIEDALARLDDTRLFKYFDKHLDDERRHQRVFLERFQKMRKEANLEPSLPPPAIPQAKHLSLLEAVAYLEVQESRAVGLIKAYVELFEGDEESTRALERAADDERFHAGWTHVELERWAEQGRADEVAGVRALARAVDRRAFWIQIRSFLRVMPGLLLRGYLPPLRVRPAPMHA